MQVFGHRGACGYLPENTMESFELAFEQGADAIEFDVVMTRDAVPVIRHDRDLTHTTDIAKHNFLTTLTEELDSTDLAQLRAVERYPDGRAESAGHDGKYQIPNLEQVLENQKFDGKHLIVEIKDGKHLKAAGLDPVPALANLIAQTRAIERGLKLTIESFEFDVLLAAKKAIGPAADFVFLSAPETLPAGFTEITDELLAEIAENFDGLSVAIPMILTGDLVARAKASNLSVFTYTARVETAEGSWESWFTRLAQSGVDGIFCDQPDLMIQTVSSLA